MDLNLALKEKRGKRGFHFFVEARREVGMTKE
jgi:hypothetical protein